MRWKILIISSLSIGIIFLDFSILPLAITAIQKELDISNLFCQWLMNAYTLSIAASLLTFGRLSQYLGRKKVFCTGLLVFEIASLMCAISHFPWHLMLGRILQGIGASMVMPTSSAIISTHFSKAERGKAIGIYSSTGSLFFAVGPLIGGLLTQIISWRAIFWLNIPLGFLSLYTAIKHIPDEPPETQHNPFSMKIALVWLVSISMIVGGIMQTQHWGWRHPMTPTLILCGIASLIALILDQRRSEKPFIHFDNFAKRPFLTGLACIGLNQVLVVMIVFWSIFLQKILGFNPIKAGLLTLVAYMPVVIASMLAGFLVDRYGPRLPVVIGFFISSCALLILGFSTASIDITVVTLAFVLLGLGIPMISPPSFVFMIHQMPKEQIALASSVNNTFRQMFSALSVAIIGSSLYFSVGQKIMTKIENASWAETIPDHAIHKLVQGRLNPKEAFKEHLGDEILELEALYRYHFEKGFSQINFMASAIAMIGLAVAVVAYPRKRLTEHEHQDVQPSQEALSQDVKNLP
jgi:EmrB/QacA subfamily drug resistance transporter